jgi:hypothetical protein
VPGTADSETAVTTSTQDGHDEQEHDDRDDDREGDVQPIHVESCRSSM